MKRLIITTLFAAASSLAEAQNSPLEASTIAISDSTAVQFDEFAHPLSEESALEVEPSGVLSNPDSAASWGLPPLSKYSISLATYSDFIRSSDFAIQSDFTYLSGVVQPDALRFPLPTPQQFPWPERIAFSMPNRANMILHNRLRLAQGVLLPAASANRGRMMQSSGGYMPIYRFGNHQIGLKGSTRNFSAMGFSNSLSALYGVQISDRVTFFGGVQLGDNYFHGTRFRNLGLTGRMRVELADRLWINGFGNYPLSNSASSLPLPPGMYPSARPSYGGSVELRITEHFGLEGGVIREYNPFKRRWDLFPYIIPKFYP